MLTVRVSTIIVVLMVASFAAQAQEQTFVLDASLPCCAAGEHRFGWLDAANAGVDPADAPEPPPPLGSYLAAAFRMPGVVEPELWRRDMRGSLDYHGDLRETWELLLSTNTDPATCTVSIAAAMGDPQGLVLVFFGAYEDTVTVPATVSFPLDGEAQLFIEVISTSVTSGTVTWGAVKSMYN